jgi:hypothetical protein
LPTIPQRPLGRDVWSWATALHLDRVTAESRLGRRLSTRDQIIGTGPKRLARRHGVQLRPRMTGADGRAIGFADGSTSEYDAVLWATGFHPRRQLDRHPRRHRQRRTDSTVPGHHTLSRALHARPHLATHPRLGATGMGRQRRRVPRSANRSHHPVNSSKIAHGDPSPRRRWTHPSRMRLSKASRPVIWGVVGTPPSRRRLLASGGCPQQLSTPAS